MSKLPQVQGHIGSYMPEFQWLSTFYKMSIDFEGITYKNLEAAYQAQKTLDPMLRATFSQLRGDEARKAGKTIQLRSDWKNVKMDIMEKLLRIKFHKNGTLAKYLVSTKDDIIEEFNYFGDTFWGIDHIKGGENYLGKMLMRIREDLAKQMYNPSK